MVRNVEAAVGIARGVLNAAAQCCVAASLAVSDALVHAVFGYCASVFWSSFVVYHLVDLGPMHRRMYAMCFQLLGCGAAHAVCAVPEF